MIIASIPHAKDLHSCMEQQHGHGSRSEETQNPSSQESELLAVLLMSFRGSHSQLLWPGGRDYIGAELWKLLVIGTLKGVGLFYSVTSSE